MNPLESAPSKEHGIHLKDHLATDIDGRVSDILDGPPSDNYMKRQMQLAVEMSIEDDPDAILDHNALDLLMIDWANSDMSKGFSDVKKDPGFDVHPRLQGRTANITLDDVRYHLKNGGLPEE